ncbi:MAG: GGDEF domain-containing protein [Deltaproteobacteria bacterium]|nr:GGDEF domain-containing protein [Deltaproteobacteria bacterium]
MMKQNIRELLRKTLSRNSDDLLERDMERYRGLFGDAVYPEIMSLLTGKILSVSKSRRYWCDAVALRDVIRDKTGYRIGMRATLLEVVQNSSGQFKNMVFIEARRLDSIMHCSVRDGLTGLYNQTYFKTLLNRKAQIRRREDDNSSALILLDLDHFKHYNDSCGHVAGDEALRIMAGIIREQIREQDVAARYGGDEFAVYLPKVMKNVAFAVADRIRLAVESTVFPGEELLKGVRLTTSTGISFFSDETNDVNTLLETADRELYNAKRLRNAVSPCSLEHGSHIHHVHQAPPVCFRTMGKLPAGSEAFLCLREVNWKGCSNAAQSYRRPVLNS